MTLDLAKEYGTVHGFGRARFFQSGRYYAEDGAEIEMSENGYEVEGGEENIPKDLEAEALEASIKEKRDEFEAMDWREIKERVLELGGEWNKSKTEGIDYLISIDG